MFDIGWQQGAEAALKDGASVRAADFHEAQLAAIQRPLELVQQQGAEPCVIARLGHGSRERAEIAQAGVHIQAKHEVGVGDCLACGAAA